MVTQTSEAEVPVMATEWSRSCAWWLVQRHAHSPHSPHPHIDRLRCEDCGLWSHHPRSPQSSERKPGRARGLVAGQNASRFSGYISYGTCCDVFLLFAASYANRFRFGFRQRSLRSSSVTVRCMSRDAPASTAACWSERSNELAAQRQHATALYERARTAKCLGFGTLSERSSVSYPWLMVSAPWLMMSTLGEKESGIISCHHHDTAAGFA